MDGRKNNGAKKGENRGQGRKPKAAELNLAETMDKYCEPEKFWDIVYGLVQQGDVQAVKLWAAYRFGAPKQSIEQHNTGAKEIVIVRDGNSYPQIRAASGAGENTEQPEEIQRN